MVQYIKGWFRKLEEDPVPEKDPIIYSSLGTPLAIFSLLLMLSLVWALYEEMFGLRPWREHQATFASLYRSALQEMVPLRVQEVAEIKSSMGYQKLEEKLLTVEKNIALDLQNLEGKERQIRAQLDVITKSFASSRSELQAKMYELETAHSQSSREDLRDIVEKLKLRSYEFEFSSGIKKFTYLELEEFFNDLKVSQGELQAEKSRLLKSPGQLRSELRTYLDNRLTGLTETQINGLISGIDNSSIEIKQIHNPEMNLVDRCESCHLGIREPVQLTPANMAGNRLFVSHTSSSELLAIHDPEVFGCSPCHNGNGVGTVSTTRAHGKYKHWLRPLYSQENFEAGCVQCHLLDRQLKGSETFNSAKGLFQDRGCRGCHAYEGFDVELAQIREARKKIGDLELSKETTRVEIERLNEQGDSAETNEQANNFYAKAIQRTLRIAEIDADSSILATRLDGLLMERKRVGPNLKEIRNKLRREWIPSWIKNPQEFRSTTKMPHFDLTDEEVQAISAFIWQSSISEGIDSQISGDVAHGQDLFESRGCLACHSVGEGKQAMGGSFASNLTRVGEKANYDYLVRWIHNPRERTLPYDPVVGRDVTREDYESHNLPFRFDLENNKSPLGDHTLQVQNETVMPNLRLTWQESRDVASYLMTLKSKDIHYEDTPFMDDSQLFDKGRFLVRHYGCAGCHEIATLEEEGKIGTNLTLEGSKPKERLDFALLTHEAKEEGWYNHKGFFEHKLRDPSVFDRGKLKNDLEQLRMPNFHFSDVEVDQLTTLLLGSVESWIPERFHYAPSDERKDIQEGWWVVNKYNCQSCHEFSAGEDTVLQKLTQYQGEQAEKLPPSLVGEGARANPEWLANFLKNPALRTTHVNTNGVRPYLDVRMPTFNLSDGEIGVLVRFFAALSKQPVPYLSPQLKPLSREERAMARDLFTSNAAPCLRCHATGDSRKDSEKTAPDFALVNSRLKPDWTRRWLVHPEIIRPGTAMPSGLFRWDGQRWVFALADLPSFRKYKGDHAELVVRYMFEFTEKEQQRLSRR